MIDLMKLPFTPFQAVLTSLSTAATTFCIAADVFIIAFDRGTVNERAVTVNLILSAAVLIVSVILIFKAGDINTCGRAGEDEDRQPAASALRTYFCMLAFDFSGVLVLMLAGALVYKNAGKAILIFAPAVFIISALTYFIRVGRIGLDDYSDPEGDDPFSDDDLF